MGAADRIADTLLRIGEIQGTAANRSAEIQARALEQAAQARAQGVTGSADALARATAANGQIWGQTLGSLGELPNQYLRTAAALKTNDLENQGRQIQIDRAKQVQAGEAAFQKILPQIPRGQDGLFDVSAATPVFASSGMTAEQTSNMIRTLDALNQAQVGVNKTRIDHAADLANHALEDAKKTGEPLSVPGAVLWLNGAREAGVATDAEVNQIKQGLVNGADPTHIFSAIRGQSDKYKPRPEKLSAGDVVVDLNNPGGPPLASAPSDPSKDVIAVNGQLVHKATAQTIGAPIPPQQTPGLAETARHNQAMEAIAKLTQGRAEATAAETARHNRATELANNPFGNVAFGGSDAQPGAAGVTTPPENPTGQAVLAKLSPGVASQVKALAEGRQPFPSAMALKTPYWQQMLQLVGQYDPSFDAVNYSARASTRKDFTSGKSAQQVNALNTVVGHLSELSDKADALGNGSTQFVNSVRNWVSTQAGSPKVTNFETAKQAVADELTRVYRQAGGSEQDIKSWQASLGAANSPEQLHGAFATISDLLESKLGALDKQYQQGMGTSAVSMITPAARKALDKLAGRAPDSAASGVTVTSPGGKTYPFPDQAAADRFVADAKSKGLWK